MRINYSTSEIVFKEDKTVSKIKVHLVLPPPDMTEEDFYYLESDEFIRRKFKTICGGKTALPDTSNEYIDDVLYHVYVLSKEELLADGMSFAFVSTREELPLYANEEPCEICFHHPDVLLSILKDVGR